MRQILLGLFLIFLAHLSAQPTFKQEYEFIAPDVAAEAPSFVQMPDSGFMMVNSRALIFSDSVIILTRLDQWGGIMWVKEIPFSPHQDWLPNIVRFNDNEYAILAGDLVMKIDSGGNVIWCKKTTPGFMNFNVTKDEGLILQGVQLIPNNDGIVNLAKLDSMGNVQWSTAVDTFTEFPVGITAVPIANGGEVYISVSETNGNVTSPYAAITGVSDAGALLWTWHTRWNYRPDVLVTPDSGVWLVGEGYIDTNWFNHGIVITCIDPVTGQVSSMRSIYPTDGGYMNASIQGDTIIATGQKSNMNNTWQRWYVCFDTALNVHYAHFSSLPSSSIGFFPWSEIKFTSDGGYAMATRLPKPGPPAGASVYFEKAGPGGIGCNDTSLAMTSGSSVWFAYPHYNQLPLVATTVPATISIGTTPVTIIGHCWVSVTENESEVDASFYPNPTSGLVTVQLGELNATADIVIINTVGQTVLKFNNFPSGGTLDCSSLATGYYFILVNGMIMKEPMVITGD